MRVPPLSPLSQAYWSELKLIWGCLFSPDVPMKFLVFDTETTGLPTSRSAPLSDSKSWPHVVQLSFMLYDGATGQVLCTTDHLLKLPPGMQVPPESTAIHGVTTSQLLRRGVEPSVALGDFIRCLDQADYIVAHNIEFDRAVLMAEAFRQAMEHDFREAIKTKKDYCTMKNGRAECSILAKRKNGSTYLKYPKLEELYAHLFGTRPNGTHDALADVLICGRCFARMTGRDDPLKASADTRRLFDLYRI